MKTKKQMLFALTLSSYGAGLISYRLSRRFIMSANFVRAFFVDISRWRYTAIATKELQINYEINEASCRIIDNDGKVLGIMSSADAVKIAESKDLDLVLIAPQAQPPVAKIMDYGKYRFEQQKKEKEARKNQHVVEIKEIRLSLNIGQHDFDTKVGHAEKFLKEGNRVKVSIRFRGRERAHANMGNETMDRFAQALAEFGTVDKPAKMEGRGMQMFLAPKTAK